MFKFIQRRLQSQKGFTMIEALMIAAILGVMITGFASYQYQRARAAKSQELKKEYGQLQNNVKSSIGQSEALTQTEDVQYLRINGTITPTPIPSPTTAPDAAPPTCPDSRCNFVNGRCEISSACWTTSDCPPGCTIVGAITTTNGGGGNDPGGGGNNPGDGNNPVSTATPTPDPNGVKCTVPYCHLGKGYITTCKNNGTPSSAATGLNCSEEDGGQGGNCTTCSLVAPTCGTKPASCNDICNTCRCPDSAQPADTSSLWDGPTNGWYVWRKKGVQGGNACTQ